MNETSSLARLRVVLYADDALVASTEDTRIWTEALEAIVNLTRDEDEEDDD